jgi:hypothetical protein
MGPPDIPKDIRRSDPATVIADDLEEGMNRMHDAGYKEAIKSWSRFRFVRAGWFTPAEAIDYIE